MDYGNYTSSEGTDIQFAAKVKDLGIQISNDLSFAVHITSVTAKGKQMAGWILRVFTNRSPPHMKICLKQLILPRIEYCCVLWSPNAQALINKLESVQRFFTKKINFGREGNQPDYWERLELLKIYSVERRRERYTILYTWKVIHNLYPNPGLSANILFPGAHVGHPAQGIDLHGLNERTGITVIHHQQTTQSTAIKSRSVLNKCCDLYNTLPASLRRPIEQGAEPKLLEFKMQLDRWLATIPDQPTIPGRIRAAPSNSILVQKDYTL